jgi:uncharacterized protein YydD (DUF2326 family)
MIRSITANKPTFKTVHFEPGFNAILADTTSVSTDQDTRNGLGKSSLIDVIHFCLGSDTARDKSLASDQLSDWEFTIELEFKTGIITATRGMENPSVITFEGHTDEWPIKPKEAKDKKSQTLKVTEWRAVLGFLMFGLHDDDLLTKYNPSFRSLIPYFMRRGVDAYSTPFEHFRKQGTWSTQVNNGFLLGLNWKQAAKRELLRDKKGSIDKLRSGLKAGFLSQYLGKVGELEAEQVSLKDQIEDNRLGLETFQVHPQYAKLEQWANDLTKDINRLRNQRVKLARRKSYYQESFEKEDGADNAEVQELYELAGIELPTMVVKRLEDVQKFHASIVSNRESFLSTEIDDLQKQIDTRSVWIDEKSKKRAELMETLKSHGPWEDYQMMTEAQAELVGKLEALSSRIETIKEIQNGTSNHKIEKEHLLQEMRQDYDDRKEIRRRAVSAFNANSQALYNSPGKLVIDVSENGFEFDIDIERSNSSGIGAMKVMCYDLVLAELWANKEAASGVLIHDSLIFDPVDERQRASSIELAASKSKQLGFQYICTLNSDMVPYGKFSKDFTFDNYVRLRLTDDVIEGSLMGIRF